MAAWAPLWPGRQVRGYQAELVVLGGGAGVGLQSGLWHGGFEFTVYSSHFFPLPQARSRLEKLSILRVRLCEGLGALYLSTCNCG